MTMGLISSRLIVKVGATFCGLLVLQCTAFAPTSVFRNKQFRCFKVRPLSLSELGSSLDSTSGSRMTTNGFFRQRFNSRRLKTKKRWHQSTSSLLTLFAETDGPNGERKIEPSSAVNATSSSFLTDFKVKVDTTISVLRDSLPEPLVSFFSAIFMFWNKIKWHLLTFTTGAVVSLFLVLMPIYQSMENLKQPVVLFETILSDIEQAYVEPVDTNKLFETGIAAMLNSLDPYTEFEGVQEAQDMTESIEGRYGGVGLVIAGVPASSSAAIQSNNNLILPDDAKQDAQGDDTIPTTPVSSSGVEAILQDDEDDVDDNGLTAKQKFRLRKLQDRGIRVVSAFEGYAFDFGMRVGDRLVKVDDTAIGQGSTVDQVRNALRGEPGTLVTIQFERDGVEGIQSVTMPRAVVKIRDVKLATLLGDPADGIGYIQLSGFASDAGREMRQAITYLQRAAEDASHGERPLQGLVLDLRNNPGGLLTSSVDVASLLVPKGSDIVSARGRGFPGIIYRSRVDPILDTSQTKLAVLVNGNTASAAEIVSGAVQDLDVGIIVGQDRTFGKGLVQNVEELPYNTALKFTVAKYYTPSGRCIQGVNYKEGAKDENDGKYVASKVADKDRGTFYTRLGRAVRDGGGVEADYKVESSKASVLEITLLRAGVMSDFAAEWSKKNELTNNFEVDENTYKSFQAFVNEKQKNGELQLESLYDKPLADLRKALKASGYSGSEKSVDQLQAKIVREIQNDFEKYRTELKEDISQNILARYLPESMLIERGVQKDPQVQAAVKLLTSRNTFDTLLAKGSTVDRNGAALASGPVSVNVATGTEKRSEGFRSSIKW